MPSSLAMWPLASPWAVFPLSRYGPPMGDVLSAAQHAAQRVLALGNDASALLREVGIDPDDAAVVWQGFPVGIDPQSAFGIGLIIGAIAIRSEE